jgi:putative sigma-54 modulation protein
VSVGPHQRKVFSIPSSLMPSARAREIPVEVRVHAKGTTIGDDLRALAVEKVGHAARLFDDAQSADVEFSEEQNPRITGDKYRVEITSKAGGQVVRVEVAGFDQRAALEGALDKLERQLSRLKERLIARHRKGNDKHLNHSSESVEEGPGTANARIERVKRFIVKPMMPEEAALEMELLGHSFYLFLNAETERYSVVYRRRGGSLGLIEPQ